MGHFQYLLKEMCRCVMMKSDTYFVIIQMGKYVFLNLIFLGELFDGDSDDEDSEEEFVEPRNVTDPHRNPNGGSNEVSNPV